LGAANANALGQYIPVAVPDTATFSGSDYYVIGLKDYRQRLHSDLPSTTDSLGTGTKLRGYYQINGTDHNARYLGPLIIANRDRPVRILFENHLGVGTAGDLFIPVDTTAMGAGLGPLGASCGGYSYGCNYTQNRATLHLHGGNTPWISDGTPHQWVAPVGEFTTPYLRGATQRNVPDMPNPGAGKATFFYTNQQSSRLMFYHDHAYGITRLNVYAGEAAGYLLTDQFEEDLLAGTNVRGINPTLAKVIPDIGGVYHWGIPLVIQDKTFVPWDVAIQDSKWNKTKWGQPGDLWFPHVYEPNQMPNDIGGANPFGRWDYGPWFWPPVIVDSAHSTLPDPSMVPEAFMDTPIVNGAAYPNLPVEPKAYRFRVLNATNDRALNLQLYVADPLHISVSQRGAGYQTTTVIFSNGGGGSGASAIPTIAGGVITGFIITSGGSGYITAPLISFGGSGGSLATATATITNGIVTAITLGPSGGTGYIPGPTVNLTGGGGTGAAATAVVTSGVVSGFTGLSSGSLYATNPAVTFTGGGGAGAAAFATISGGAVTGITITNGGSGYTSPPGVTIAPPANPAGVQASVSAIITPGVVTNILVTNPGTGYTSAPVVTIDPPTGPGGIQAYAIAAVNTEVKMVSALPQAGSNLPVCATPTETNVAGLAIGALDSATDRPLNGTGLPANCWPTTWPVDGRDGGVPEPTRAGPAIIQIGTEGGFLPKPVVIPSTPVGYNYNRRDIVVLNVLNKGLFMQPAERADIIVDFSPFAGKNIILYNDAPAPMPGFDPRNDYYTDSPDNSPFGGAPTTVAGYGPNTRTIMRFQVAATPTAPVTTISMNALATAIPAAFNASQPAPIVPQTAYPAPNNAATDTFARIQDFSLTFTPGSGTFFTPPGVGPIPLTRPVTIPMQTKAIQELWDPYGRMNATLGVELPFTNNNTQTTIPLGYIDPTTEIVPEGQTQLWKITHNGVDTHPVHFHLYNIQVINRVGWDGAIRPTEDNELGWKETVRMSPLEDVIVALQPKTMTLPVAWGTLADSVHSEDVTSPTSASISVIDPFGINGGTPGNAITVSNTAKSFGWEYVWHCHILGHEENDFMRSFVLLVPTAAPAEPSDLTAVVVSPTLPATAGNAIQLDWTDMANLDPTVPDLSTQKNAEIGFEIQRNGTIIANVYSGIETYLDTEIAANTTYNYAIHSYNASGASGWVTASPVTTSNWVSATGVNLSPGVPSPAPAGTPVVFTATGIGSTVPYQYRFWLTAGAVPSLIPANMVQDYGVGNTWTLPATTLPGTYSVSVGVRTNLSSTTPDPLGTTSLTYVVAAPVVGPGLGTVRRSTPPTPTITPYTTVTAAFGAAVTGDTIQAWGLAFPEPGAITFTTAGTVTFQGGYDTTFTTTPFMTTVQTPSFTVAGIGTLIVVNLTIQ
jgi:FtsP/CotA-like multicopper oxidase with cupredoxin domain